MSVHLYNLRITPRDLERLLNLPPDSIYSLRLLSVDNAWVLEIDTVAGRAEPDKWSQYHQQLARAVKRS